MKRLISSLQVLSMLLSCLPMGTRAAGSNMEVLYPSNGENTGSLDSIYDDMIANSPTLPNLEPTISGSMGTLEPTVPGELIPATPLPTVPSGGLSPETDDTTPPPCRSLRRLTMFPRPMANLSRMRLATGISAPLPS